MQTLTFKISIPVQSFIINASVFSLLLYRKLRYGHPYRLIPLTRGLYAKVDPDKYEQLSQYKWHTLKGSRTYGVWYAARSAVINGKTYTIRMHQVIMAKQLEDAQNQLNAKPDPNSKLKIENLALHSPQGGVGSELPDSTNSKLKIKNLALHSPQGGVGSKLTNLPCKLVVDHINGDGLDNRLANLRVVTPLQNCWNRRLRRRNCSSKYTGVSWEKKNKKWRARIFDNGKKINLGFFDDEILAAKAYDAAVLKYRGKYGVLNFPSEN